MNPGPELEGTLGEEAGDVGARRASRTLLPGQAESRQHGAVPLQAGEALQGAGGIGAHSAGPGGSDPGWPLSLQIAAQQMAAQGQPQKVAYAAQPALKTQFLTTPISQAQKLAGTQQVQTQIQVSVNRRQGRWRTPQAPRTAAASAQAPGREGGRAP